MKKDIKMSDVFLLPMQHIEGDNSIYSDDCRHTIIFDESDTDCEDQKNATVVAINNYDRLVAENEKQSEQIKVLLEEKQTRCNIANTHVFVDCEEFNSLATFVMCNDSADQDSDMDDVHLVLNQIAVKCLGYKDWLDAYHSIE